MVNEIIQWITIIVIAVYLFEARSTQLRSKKDG